MKSHLLNVGCAALFLSFQVLACREQKAADTQASATETPEDSAAPRPMMGANQSHPIMDSLNARLDSLVGRMNRATGEAKVAAMADVLNELVAQRRGMQARMGDMIQAHREMMQGRRMSPMRMDSSRGRNRRPS